MPPIPAATPAKSIQELVNNFNNITPVDKDPKEDTQWQARGKNADFTMEMRLAVVGECFYQRQPAQGGEKGYKQRVRKALPAMNLSESSIKRIMKAYRDHRETRSKTSLSNKRKGRAATNMKCSPAILKRMKEIDHEHRGSLPYDRLHHLLVKEGFDCSLSSVRVWAIKAGCRKRRLFLRPKLRLRHRLDRLDWVLNELVSRRSRRFGSNTDTVHLDEKVSDAVVPQSADTHTRRSGSTCWRRRCTAGAGRTRTAPSTSRAARRCGTRTTSRS